MVPTISVMYGYNAVIWVKNRSEYNRIFYGTSIGIGLDAHFKPKNAGYWAFELFYPIRGAEVNDYINDLKDNHGATLNELTPITFSIGRRFIID